MTPEQRLTLLAISEFRDKFLYTPGAIDVATYIGMSVTGTHYRLCKLRDLGMITWLPRCPRTIQLTQKGEDYVNSIGSS